MDSNEGYSLESSYADPIDQIYSREFIDGVLKAGSLISMIENKKINVTSLFLLVMQNKHYQDFFTEITSSASFRDAILSLLFLYPSLVKSKLTKSFIRKVNATANKQSRKSPVQQTPSSVSFSKKQALQTKKRFYERVGS